MYDEQIKRIIEKTFREVDVLIREVQEEKSIKKNTTTSAKLREKEYLFQNQENVDSGKFVQ